MKVNKCKTMLHNAGYELFYAEDPGIYRFRNTPFKVTVKYNESGNVVKIVCFDESKGVSVPESDRFLLTTSTERHDFLLNNISIEEALNIMCGNRDAILPKIKNYQNLQAIEKL